MADTIGSISSRTDSRGTPDPVTVNLRTQCRDVNPVTRRAVCPVIPASPLSRQQNARPFLSALGIVNGMGRWVMGNGLMTATHMGFTTTFLEVETRAPVGRRVRGCTHC